MRLERRVDQPCDVCQGLRFSCERTTLAQSGSCSTAVSRPSRSRIKRASTTVLTPDPSSTISRRSASTISLQTTTSAAGRSAPSVQEIPAGVQKWAQDLQGLQIGGVPVARAPRHYLPVKFGSRFCMKASTPSMKSAEAPLLALEVRLGLELLMEVGVDHSG